MEMHCNFLFVDCVCVFAGTLRVRVVYRDVRNVPRNHIRYRACRTGVFYYFLFLLFLVWGV